MKRDVRVVAAVIRRGDAVLVTQRLPGSHLAGFWEFPGGKVEPGEDDAAALRREIAEELACEIEVGELVLRHRHAYPDLDVELAFYDCSLVAGSPEPRPVGVAALRWADESGVAELSFCEADVPVLQDLVHRR